MRTRALDEEAEVVGDLPDGGPGNLAGELAFAAIKEEVFEEDAVADEKGEKAMIVTRRLWPHFPEPHGVIPSFNLLQIARHDPMMERNKLLFPHCFNLFEGFHVVGSKIDDLLMDYFVSTIFTRTIVENHFTQQNLSVKRSIWRDI